MVPRDLDPGAIESGAEKFVLDLLAEYPEWIPVYTVGLQDLAKEGFANLSPEKQDDLLRQLDLSKDPREAEFMKLISQQAIEAFYTSLTGFDTVGFKVTG